MQDTKKKSIYKIKTSDGLLKNRITKWKLAVVSYMQQTEIYVEQRGLVQKCEISLFLEDEPMKHRNQYANQGHEVAKCNFKVDSI